MRIPTKTEWIEALRSGKYLQGKHVLHNIVANTYCCLGVLCKLAELKEEIVERQLPGLTLEKEIAKCTNFTTPEGNTSDTTLPHPLDKMVGVSGGWANELMRLNDGSGGYECQSFQEIADILEKNDVSLDYTEAT